MRKILVAGAAFGALLLTGCTVSGAVKPGNVAKGKELFGSNCDGCHNADSTEVKIGPGLKGLFQRETLQSKKKVTDANVLAIINKGSSPVMPGFAESLTEQGRADILAYLKTL